MTFTKQIDIDQVELDPDNAMEHPDENLDAIKASLQRFGTGRSIVIDSNDVVRAGNGTVEAARAAGFTKVLVVEPEPDQLVAVKRGEWTEQEAKGYGVADNRTAQLAKFNVPALQNVIDSIPSIEPEDMGFAPDQLQALFDSVTKSNDEIDKVGSGEGEIPDPPASPVTRLGDVWLLGRHKVLCGDSRRFDQIQRMLGASRSVVAKAVQGVITDPPYGIDYRGTGHVRQLAKEGHARPGEYEERDAIHNDTPPDLEGLLRDAFGNALKLCEPGGAWYVCGPPGPPTNLVFAQVLLDLGVWRQSIAWVKDRFVFGRMDYHGQFEMMFYGWKPGAAHRYIKARDRSTVWQFDNPKQSKEHPTMKPVALFATAMNDTIPVGSTIYDPFLGSGTTIMAAEAMDRTCIGVEIEPKYCDVIVERWQNLTGDKAQRVPL